MLFGEGLAMLASSMDIGGTRARIYAFEEGAVINRSEMRLPERQDGDTPESWGKRRVDAVAELVARWTGPVVNGRLPTACAGRKDDSKESVVLSFYGSPLPSLVATIRARTGIDCGPLLDDDVCAGWGHLASARGGIEVDSPDTVLLTAGTGLAESLWVRGEFLTKGTYPRLSDLGLEDSLRAEGWRGGELPLAPLEQLIQARASLGDFTRVVLSGRFAGVNGWPPNLGSVELVVAPLEEAPALGALALCRHR